MKSLIKIVFFCLLFTTTFSQEKLDTIVFNKNIKLANKLLQTDIDSSYSVIKKNLYASFKYKYAFGCYYAHEQLCTYYRLKGNIDSVLLYTSNLIKFARVLKDTSKIVNAYLTLVRAACNNSNYKLAIQNCMLAQRFADASNITVLRISVYHNLGLIYSNLDGTSEKALNYFKQGVQLAKAINDTFNLANLSARIGGEYYDLNKHDSALKYSLESYQLFSKINHLRGQGVALNNLATAYCGKKDYNNSNKYYLLALQIREKLKDVNGMSILYNNLSLNYYELKNYKQALYYALLNEKLTANSKDPNMIASTQKQLKSIYAKLGNYELAYKNANSYIIHLDSMSSKSNLKTLVDLQTKYETDKKEKEIAILELQNKNSE